LIEGFMGLGLIVGVAAFRGDQRPRRRRAPPAHRRLRAIGFRGRMIQVSFLIESSCIALTATVVGTLLGIAVA
jgi:putative ABC transport system permease protein